jgi:beta-phosphoglucomutase
MIKAVVFDMDGVLIDAKDWHYEALNRALELFGYTISRQDHLTIYDGLPTKTKLSMLTRQNGLPAGLHGLINDLKQHFTADFVTLRCQPVFQHQFALAQLKALGYRVGLASNSIRATIDLMMNRARLTGYLDAILSNEDVRDPKPAPDIYLAAAQHLGVTPYECLVVEDNEKGVTAATRAGAHVLQVETVDDVRIGTILDRVASINRSRTRAA